MSTGASEPHLDRLRDSALESVRRAATARQLAADIRRRRAGVVTRIENSLAEHTAAVWSSRAAEQSRDVLHHEVGFGVWLAALALNETSHALESSAADHEDDAGDFRRQAAVLEAEVAVAAPLDPIS